MAYCLLSPGQGDNTEKQTWSACLCCQSYRAADAWELCSLYTVLCLSIQIVLLVHEVYISLVGSGEGSRFTLHVQFGLTDSGRLQK